MGTTPRGYHYPEPTELLTNAHAHIKALGQDVDADVTAQVNALNARIDAETAASYFVGSGGIGVNIADGASALLGWTPLAASGWEYDGSSRLIYHGPQRLVMVSTTVRINAQNQPANVFESRVSILANGGLAAESRAYLDVASVDDNLSIIHPHAPSALGIFNEGDFVQVQVSTTNGYGESVNVDGARWLNIAGLNLIG